ncbi:hypothetical protein [Myceligenerans indicum]|uniref:Uncharacterized protein n=1 Tax=Myceligenerans indicum TaxID=2593663 RepID=A0ABS1LN81_9MICO|nr:hypothetical protein [Myceligenerans indicum]MBL0887711.1 hypothetical protein [Myceligenerans indicum]
MSTAARQLGGSSLRRGAVIGLGVAGCLVAVVIEFALGEGSVVDALALIVSYLALTSGGSAAVVSIPRMNQYVLKDAAEPWTVRFARAAVRHQRLAWTIGGSFVLVLASGVYLAWFYVAASSVPVTGTVTTSGATDLQDCYVQGPDGAPDRRDECDAATVLLPGRPPVRDHVTVVGHVANRSPDGTGTCVEPARVVVTPYVDGNAGTAVRARSGEPADVSVTGATASAWLEVSVDQLHDDEVCRVDLRFTKVVLHD